MIKLVNVNKSFSGNQVLKNINLHVKKGDIVGIVGHSGAGKSTLLRCLNALETYDSGSVTIMGNELKELSEKEVKTMRKKLGMIFQNFNLLNRKNVFDNIALPLEVWNFDKAYIEKKVTNLVKLVGLEDKIHSMPKDLSGGQKQRVGIARALALDPEILLCDEATSALDPNTTKSILELIKKINEELNITVVLVTHQMEVVKEICNRVALMEKGEIKGEGTVEELFLKPDKDLQKLLGENEVLPESGVNIKIFFPKEYSQQCIITSIARELDIDFSIVWGKLEKFRDNVLGSLVINTNEQYKENICKFLDSKSIIWEVIENDD
ncbi:methionine ABC transporter ATP-binding protein [Clostridium carboxidivorans P7]|uniref:ABC transporter related protein n=1 Tax=Clostridium carboxidivorans P7 TaxID=536227 RepID=C6PUK6_9CLOT|nr:methionine ABC transporter ATP-binding protein [Clostridium carboxidivorans]AKN32201.1 methionine ABC transporter ATP-binding protein [Clostridium carboxidivorans P7]EET87109.1 ABC transporter related protein [Clostridium carboxidivorans P7]